LPPAVAPARAQRSQMPLYVGAAAVLILAVAMTAWIMQRPGPEGGIPVPPGPAVEAQGPPPVTAPATSAPATSGSAPAASVPSTDPPSTDLPSTERAASGAAGENRRPDLQVGRERPSPPAAVPPSSAKPPRLLVVGKDVQAPRRIRYVEPVYPESAGGAEGQVGIELTIGRDGRVADARVTKSIAGLDRAALAAVRQWEFVPSVVRGAAVPVIYPVNVAVSASPAAKPAPAKPVATEVKPPPAEVKPPPPPPSTPAPAVSAPAASAKPAEPPPVDLRAEEAAVRSVLKQYESAWESRDADAVARVQRLSPDALKRVRDNLESVEEYSLTLTVQSLVVDPDGRRARAVASIARSFRQSRRSTVKFPTATSTFTLEKRDGRWVITAIQ
ncbi:MAG: TonB family protein, partial [Vicinamibacterales bacterium]